MPSPGGSTPIFGFPYLLESDVPDVATASQELATDIENVLVNASVPVGGSIDWWSTTLPAEGVWLFLHGAVVSATGLYAPLAAVYPAWVAAGNITLPDTRDRVIVGAGTTYAAKATGGSATVTLATGNIPQFTPTVSITDPGHEHLAYVAEVGTGDQFVFTSNVSGPAFSIPTNANAGAGPLLINSNSTVHIQTANTGISGTVTIGSGSPTPVATLPPYIGAHQIIRAA